MADASTTRGLRVIGAGMGRTGTLSLKVALERLLAAPCYHMEVVTKRPKLSAAWTEVVRAAGPSWDELFAGYAATVDWPGASFWQPLSEHFPDALVLLSTRSSADEWYASVEKTIRPILEEPVDPRLRPVQEMSRELWVTTVAPLPMEKGPTIAAYEEHNALVRRTVAADRLVEWQPRDGWGPLCDRLGVPVPDVEFPHVNSTQEFVALPSRPPTAVQRLRSALRRR